MFRFTYYIEVDNDEGFLRPTKTLNEAKKESQKIIFNNGYGEESSGFILLDIVDGKIVRLENEYKKGKLVKVNKIPLEIIKEN